MPERQVNLRCYVAFCNRSLIFVFLSLIECTNIEKSGNRPFICMDLCYITHLLQDLGFPKDKRLKVTTILILLKKK